MGSQTVEILRQGVWASLTGGWFYDPHQNVFCNAIHLYLWLFLLCTPFVTYLYFSKTIATWTVYCLSSGITIAAVKLINLALHVMYDQAQIISDSNLKKSTKVLRETSGTEDGGIEMQILGATGASDPLSRTSIENNNNNSNEMSQANSAMSIDYPEQVTSTIDLKVDVHRKNSSESSDSLAEQCLKNAIHASSVVTHNAEVCQTVDYRHAIKTKSKSEDAAVIVAAPIVGDTNKDLYAVDDGDLLTRCEERRDKFLDMENPMPLQRSEHKKRLRTKLQRQTSLDSTEAGIGLVAYGSEHMTRSSKLQRHRSHESNDERRRYHRYHHYGAFYHQNQLKSLAPEMLYLDPNFTTKSELAIENFPHDSTTKIFVLPSKKTPMRKDSNSTMSAIQLPAISGGNSGTAVSATSRQRRHSNTTGKQHLLPAGIVSVRRIKSTALETCCPQPSVSNLSPHPNSVETIGGRPLRNPQHAVLPPPSKCLVRNPHFNFFPKGANGSSNIAAVATSASSIADPVYPIAELADEKSLNDSFILTESESDDEQDEDEENDSADDNDDDDDDEENGDGLRSKRAEQKQTSIGQRKSTTSESDNERPPTQSTDSETENNNGSRSPLLDTKIRSAIFSSSAKNATECDSKIMNMPEAKVKSTIPVSPTIDLDLGEGAVGGVNMHVDAPATNTKSEDSGCPSSDCEQASASSKDMLLSRNQKPSLSDRHWCDFSIDANNISVDVIDLGEDSSKIRNNKNKLDEAKEDPLPKESKSLGAIPKTHFSRYDNADEPSSANNPKSNSERDNNGKPLSRASSSNSFSGGSCDFENQNRHPLEVLHQTKDGWILQSASSNNPYLVAQRGELPPLMPIYNTRPDNIFPVTRKPYLCLHPSYRQYQPKLRSSRNRRQNSSIDTTASGRDGEDNSSMTAAGGGSGSVGTGSGWDFLDIEVQESINTFIIQELMENQHSFKQSIAPERITQPNQRSTINRMGFGDSMFWGHCNLPPEKQAQPKRYYKFPFKCFGKHEIKISMDRLQLLALFDRDYGWCQTIVAIVLASLVSILGAIVLRLGFYKDIFAFIFCFVMAGSQFSLMKSVQPDASSPIHGFNKTVAYSRPIYFCLCSSILILAYQLSSTSSSSPPSTTTTPMSSTSIELSSLPLTLFGMPFSTFAFFHIVQEVMLILLLLLPILFSFGLFPQINTFLMYVLEQLDMHVFGGNAVCSLLSAFLGVFRSILACCMLYGFAFGGLSEPRSTQHVLFSCFCALLVATAYHLSRSASDFTFLWAIIKSSFAMHHDEDEELKTVEKRSKRVEKSRSNQINNNNNDNDSSNGNGNSKKKSNHNNNNNDGAIGGSIDSKDRCAKETLSTESAANSNSVAGNSVEKKLQTATDPEIDDKEKQLDDPLPNKLKSTVNSRLKNDFLVCIVVGALIFSLHSSTIFTVLQPELNPVLQAFVIVLGFLLHYVIPQMRKYLPWLCFAKPILKQKEYGMYESSEAAKIMWFESMYVCFTFVEKNVLLPLVFISALTSGSTIIAHKFGVPMGAAIVVLCGLKSIRSSYSDPSSQYIVLLFTVLFFRMDYASASETFLIDYFVVAIVYKKTCEFLLKLQFIVTYIAPWQITWGSAFHAFAQPFSVPHSAMLFLQAALSAILSTPLNPFLGSAIFLTSYVRPIKFWERDYNTRRIDHSNTRLSSQLERDLGADDNNLNSIFYEHLTRSLQHSLCGDLLMGRWGNVSQGDCFVLASDYLNCLVHIIELGNGLCTFQMRGLEFRGTYCQQREVEAISEGVGENDGCCCCSPGHLPNLLSVNAMFSTRWLAWQVVASQYILEGYSISDNLAQATLQVYEFRKVLITYYVKSIIYYTIRSPKLQHWLTSPTIQEALQSTMDRQFVDLDPIFNHNLDEDFDFRASGITRLSFCAVYLDWIQFCFAKRNQNPKAKQTEQQQGQQQSQQQSQQQQQPQQQQQQQQTQSQLNQSESGECTPAMSKGASPRSSTNPTPSPRASKSTRNKNEAKVQPPEEEINRKSSLISLLLALGLLARRTLATATHTHSSLSGVEFFLHGLHALFKGDFRITSPRDEWVFADMDLLHSVVAPAVKMSLKLHQDHFLSPDEYDDPSALYSAITTHTNDLVISHEADPLWRNAVLRGAPQLLALRHVMEDGTDEYRLIRLSKRFLSFRVIKLNRECVRGLWAGQQQELIYLRNRNPERGSIQNAKQALRNIINSSCDQPIGYPIYVSPLTTSYAETNEQLCKIIGGAITLEKIRNMALKFCQRVRQRCREGCSSGSATLDTEMGDMQGVYYNAPTPNNTLSGTTGTLSYGSQSLSGAGNRGSLASMGKPNSSTLLAGFLIREREQERESVADRGAGVYRKRGSVITKAERERRATFPVASGSSPETNNAKDAMGSTASSLKQQMSPESSAIISSAAATNVTSQASQQHYRPNSSFSSGNLSSRNGNRTLIITSERKSKSEERQSSRDHENDESSCSNTGSILHRTSMSLPSASSATLLDNGHQSMAIATATHTSFIATPPLCPQPPKIQLNRKVIIVDASEIYDCLDLGRRIDVSWPNERMRLAGGRSSWKDWMPKEGMVGYIVHYWQPNHPDNHFRSNFNRTLFLIQIGEHFVPVGENGVKEYNTIGTDDRFRILHIPTEELRVDDKQLQQQSDIIPHEEDVNEEIEEDEVSRKSVNKQEHSV